mmetsp:Transcript_16138/g.32667  ORF Transcript_16138/g.32667 Transcript_16138/m.32667 type:complete len:102 (+) Transcript_16138:1375-1680(+)
MSLTFLILLSLLSYFVHTRQCNVAPQNRDKFEDAKGFYQSCENGPPLPEWSCDEEFRFVRDHHRIMDGKKKQPIEHMYTSEIRCCLVAGLGSEYSSGGHPP